MLGCVFSIALKASREKCPDAMDLLGFCCVKLCTLSAVTQSSKLQFLFLAEKNPCQIADYLGHCRTVMLEEEELY